jgi:hypothetical protein
MPDCYRWNSPPYGVFHFSSWLWLDRRLDPFMPPPERKPSRHIWSVGRDLLQRRMRIKDVFLKERVCLLVAERNSFHPKPKGFPMNQADDTKGNERILNREPKQIQECQRHPLAEQGADQFPTLAPVVINPNPQSFIRDIEPEIELELQVREW